MTEPYLKTYMKEDPRFRRFEIGDYTYGDPTVYDWKGGGQLRVGKYCSIASGTIILLGGEHRAEFVSTYPFHMFGEGQGLPDPGYGSKGDVNIGNDVWIGQRVAVLAGVNIGDGAVIGAAAVVASDVPPYAIVIGNPAFILRYRFGPGVVAKLLELKWWNWPHEVVLERLKDLLDSDIVRFIEKYGGR